MNYEIIFNMLLCLKNIQIEGLYTNDYILKRLYSSSIDDIKNGKLYISFDVNDSYCNEEKNTEIKETRRYLIENGTITKENVRL